MFKKEKFEYEIGRASPADIDFIKYLIRGYEKKIKMKIKWVSKFDAYIIYDEQPVDNLESFHTMVTLSTYDENWFNYLIYEYSKRTMIIEYLECIRRIKIKKDED